MKVIWFIILMTVNSDGSVNATLQYPLQPQFNNEKNCLESGQALADQEQLKVGLNNGKIFWRCEPVGYDAIQKLVSGSDT
jgi:hypothetical protein